jgi:outer membrane murein-binding lipoprotein Lpp
MARPARAAATVPTFVRLVLPIVAGLLLAGPAVADPEVDALKDEIRRLQQRIQQLESARKPPQAASAEVEDLQDRVDDLEGQVQQLRKPRKLEEALEGVTVGASLTMVGQRALKGTTTSKAEAQLNYRGDIEVEVPLDTLGRLAGFGESKLFAHVRFGQGAGLQRINPTLTATPNTTAFFLQNSEDSATLLAQAWYQFGLPLSTTRSGALPRVEGTFGKIDVFGFFDQNDVADDETESFMNNVFVHNPLLDSGFDIGADSYGFAPGLIGSYTNDINSVNRWKTSLGVFGAGAGSGFDTSFVKPLVIAQLERAGRLLRDRPGTYRVYGWTNGSTVAFANEFDSTQERHTGIGFSLDQELARHFSMFARFGYSTEGQVRFDRAFTFGGLLGGYRWGRQEDRVGLAVGWLSPSAEFEAAAPGLDADGDGNADFGWTSSKAETNVELFYAWQVNKNLQLTPSVQWIAQPGGDASAEDISIISLRAKASF